MQDKPSLMDLFNRPPIHLFTPQKSVKKPKPIQNEIDDDPLFKILSWRDNLKDPQLPTPDTYRIREVKSILQDDPLEWGNDFQGILIDIDWNILDFSQFERLKLDDKLINNGIIFIWGSSYNLSSLFQYFNQQGFQYVENFMFVMLDRNKIPLHKKISNHKNTLLNYFKKTPVKQQEETKQIEKMAKDYEIGRVSKVQQIFMQKQGDYFLQSQRVLYMFRKHHKTQPLQLRHQRTSDAFFTIGDNWQLDWKSMQGVYKMIETLLIKANYQKGKPLKLLQLWGRKDRPRKGWVTVCQNNNI